MQTRVVTYKEESYLQHFLNGKWATIRKTDQQPMSEHHPAGQSGSHNTHSRLAPSAAKQWTNCTASIGYIKSVEHRLPADDSSEYSREGTQAHDYAAECLLGVMDFEDVPENFRPHVQSYVEHCLALGNGSKPLRYIESKVPLFYMAHDNGTMDFAAVTEDHIWIRDLKYGAGVLVVSEDNEQLAIYALSLIRQLQDDGIFAFHPDTVVDIMAYQPRHREADTAKPWIITYKDLEDFCARIEAQAALIAANIEGTLEFHPDPDVCRWCRARAICPERASAMAEAFDTPGCHGIDLLAFLPDLSKEDEKLGPELRIARRIEAASNTARLKEPLEMTDSRLVAIFANAKAAKALFEDIEEFLQARADQGNPVWGTKLVDGREGNRDWNDTAAVDKLLAPKIKADRFKKELISPAQAEKELAKVMGKPEKWNTRFKNLFNGLISRAPAKKKIALATDKREAVAPLIAALPDLTEDDNDGI